MFYIKQKGLYFRGFAGGETPTRIALWTRDRASARGFGKRTGTFGAEGTAEAILPAGLPIEIVEEE